MSDIFLKAAQKKIRFATQKGLLTTEDLFDIPMKGKTSLQSVASDLYSEIKESGEISFVDDTPSTDSTLNLKMDVVKEVIRIRKDQEASRLKAAETRQKNQLIDQIIAEKQNEELRNMPIEELVKLRKGD